MTGVRKRLAQGLLATILILRRRSHGVRLGLDCAGTPGNAYAWFSRS